MSDNGAKRNKKKRKIRRKKHQPEFNLNANIFLPPNKYNSLCDKHLQIHFTSQRVRCHLEKLDFITKKGHINENIEEARKNKEIMRLFSSQSCETNKNSQKTCKKKTMKLQKTMKNP